MTRKRFIKLLMSKGMPRNDARIHAEWVVWDNRQTCKLNHIQKANGYTNRCMMLSYQTDYDAIKVVVEEKEM